MKEDWPQPSAIKCPPTIDFDAGLTRHAAYCFWGLTLESLVGTLKEAPPQVNFLANQRSAQVKELLFRLLSISARHEL